MAKIQDYITQWQKALRIEMRHLQEQGGARYIVSDGRCLERTERGAVYWFLLNGEAVLPEDSPVRLEYRGESVKGRVVAVEGFDLMIELEAYIGDRVPEALLFSEPWELLDALSKRLDTVHESLTKQKRVQQLIRGDLPAKHPAEKVKSKVHEVFLRSAYNPVTFVWGPPGTGKTYTLARAAANHYLKGKRVLIVAHSNAAVDVLMLEMARFLQKKGSWKTGAVLRYGFSRNPELKQAEGLLAGSLLEMAQPELMEEREALELQRSGLKRSGRLSASLSDIERSLRAVRRQLKEEEAQLVEDAAVLGVTLSKAAMDPLVYEREFDVVIVDEASMAYIPQTAFAASLGKRIVVCGDFRQLPPIASSQHKLTERWLKQDIFQAAKVVEAVDAGREHPNLVMLREQRRMHPHISGFTNAFIYGGRVTDSRTAAEKRQPIADLAPFAGEAAVLLDLAGRGAYCLQDAASKSRFNLYSAFVGLQLLLGGKKSGMESAGFVTPYRAQARFVSACMQDLFPDEKRITAATVHRFQGSERDLIVFDSVDSFPQPRPGILLTGKESKSLLNVAVTRARGKFIQLTDRSYMQPRLARKNALGALTAYMEETGRVRTMHHLPRRLTDMLQWVPAQDLSQLISDINNAKQSVLLSLPLPEQVPHELWTALDQREGSLVITIMAGRREEIPLQAFWHARQSAAMPFCVIDEQLIWIGMPLTVDARYGGCPQPPYVAARLASPRGAGVLLSFLELKAEQAARKGGDMLRTSYTLHQYLASWDQCPNCRSIRRAELNGQGAVRLSCDYCGGGNGLPPWLFAKYLEHANVTCARKHPLEAAGAGRDLHALCQICEEVVPVSALW
ncbi:AAA domain-containing protein [Ectobacillus ponti]|uniref:AAA domain-containing protein n=1 Tax=Ectobacillus ponti TaxID=2961894 RepID=A0AA42BRJ8_9BACI|nr:AAA domain-containing protein [Ectobacillus ponti]MCP8969564.1 AAA domain-containing protein [Ectobacillus ponti]